MMENDTVQFIVSTGFYTLFNLIIDLSLSTLFVFVLPEFIRKFNRSDKSNDEIQLFDSEQIIESRTNRRRKSSIFDQSATQALLAAAILSGNVVGEWKTNLISLMHMIITGLYSSAYLYLEPNVLKNEFIYGRPNNRITLNLHSFKTGFLFYKLIVAIIRFQGDHSTGLIVNHLVYLMLVINSTYKNQYTLFIIFGYLFDCQSIFHHFKRAFIFIQNTDTISYTLCNIINLILILFIRPYIHVHQFNWLYSIYYDQSTEYLWTLANLNASIHILDTLFLLFDYLNMLFSSFKEFLVQNVNRSALDPDNDPIFTKLRRLDSDDEIVSF